MRVQSRRRPAAGAAKAFNRSALSEGLDRIDIGAGEHPLGDPPGEPGAGEDAELARRVGARRRDRVRAGGAGQRRRPPRDRDRRLRRARSAPPPRRPNSRPLLPRAGRGSWSRTRRADAGLHAGGGIGRVVEQARKRDSARPAHRPVPPPAAPRRVTPGYGAGRAAAAPAADSRTSWRTVRDRPMPSVREAPVRFRRGPPLPSHRRFAIGYGPARERCQRRAGTGMAIPARHRAAGSRDPPLQYPGRAPPRR